MSPQPVPSFDPRRYPGPRPTGPTLVLDGACWALALTADPARPWLPPGSAPPSPAGDAPSSLRWSLAYGANASPARLVAKGLDRRGAVLLPARITGWAPAFEHRMTSYGAVPVTLVPLPGAMTATWVLGVSAQDTAVLDASEGRAPGDSGVPADAEVARLPGPRPADGHAPPRGTYRLGRIGEVVVAGRFRLLDALAYLPGPSTRIQVDAAGTPRCWPAHDQAAARRHLDAGGDWSPAPHVAAPVEGEWPVSHLLSAGRHRWSAGSTEMERSSTTRL